MAEPFWLSSVKNKRDTLTGAVVSQAWKHLCGLHNNEILKEHISLFRFRSSIKLYYANQGLRCADVVKY